MLFIGFSCFFAVVLLSQIHFHDIHKARLDYGEVVLIKFEYYPIGPGERIGSSKQFRFGVDTEGVRLINVYLVKSKLLPLMLWPKL